MPFTDQPRFRSEDPLGMSKVAFEQDPKTFLKGEEKPSVLEGLDAAFSADNTVINLVDYVRSGVSGIGEDAPDPDYDVFSDVEGTKYEPYLDQFFKASHKQDTDIIKTKIDKELDNADVLRRSGNAGFIYQLAAGVVDPSFLIPLAGASKFVKGTSILHNVLKGGITGAGYAIPQQAVLLKTQATKTLDEAGTSVALGTLLGGVLGGGAPLVAKVGKKLGNKFIPNLDKKMERDFERVPEDQMTPSGQTVKELESIGAMLNPDTIPFKGDDALLLADADGDAKQFLIDTIKAARLSPNARLPQSKAKTIRQNFVKLANASGLKFKGAEGELGDALPQSAEEIRDLRFKDTVRVLNEYDKIYKEARRNNKGLKKEVFNEEVNLHLASNPEKGIPGSGMPEAIEAAELLRKEVYDPLALEAFETGIFKRDPRKDKKGYVTYIWDKEAILLNKDKFREVVKQHFKKQQVPRAKAKIRRTNRKIEELQAVEKVRKDRIKQDVERLEDLKAIKGRSLTKEEAQEKFSLSGREKKRLQAQKDKEVTGALNDLEKEIRDLKWELGLLEAGQQLPHIAESQFNDAVEETLHTILSTDSRQPFIRTTGTKGIAKGRKLNIPYDMASPYLIRDASYLAEKYSQSMSGMIAIEKAFGPGTLKRIDETGNLLSEKDLRKVVQEYDEAGAPTIKSDKQRKQDIDDLNALTAMILNSPSKYTEDYSNAWVRASRSVRQLAYSSMLGGVALTSLVDITRLVSVHGFAKTFGKALPALIKQTKGIKMVKAEAQKGALVLNGKQASRMMGLSDFGNSYGRTGFERFLNNTSNAFTKYNGFALWNDWAETMSANLTYDKVMDMVSRSQTGKLTDVEWTYLKNITKFSNEDLSKMHTELQAHGEVVDGISIPHTDKWSNLDIARKFRTGIKNDVNRTIITTGLGDIPLWANTGVGKMMNQFRAFNFAATNKILLAGLQAKDIHFATEMVTALVMGIFVNTLKDFASGREFETEPTRIISKGVLSSGMLGILADVDHLAGVASGYSLEGYAYGRDGRINRNILANVAPAGEFLENAMISGNALFHLDRSKSKIHAMRKILPYQNVFYIRRLLDELEKGISSD